MTTQKYKECADAYIKHLLNYENFSINEKINLYLTMTNKPFVDLIKNSNASFDTVKKYLKNPELFTISIINAIIENTDGFFTMEDFIKKN